MLPLPLGAVRQTLILVFLLFFIEETRADKKVVCYYTNWSVYRPGTAKFNPQNINPYLCTHLIYAFGGFTKDNTLKAFDKYQDIEQGGYAKFTGLKTYNKNLKTLLAIGGWNEGSSRFSPLVANPERRHQFIKNILKFLRQNHFDGLDLDWEYPAHRDGGKSRDKENYALFVQELRAEFDRESSKTGRPRLLLTMAVPAGIEYIEKGYDIPKLNKYLDWFNILSYDYHSAYEPSVNHHAPLYPLQDEDDEYNFDGELNIDYTIKHYLKAGADRDKLVLGIPTYGRSYTLINEDSTDIGAPSDGPGEQGDATREKGYLAYYEICQNIKTEDDWTVVQPNPKSMGPYAFKKNQWVGYDDEDIVKKKAEYVVSKGLGGIMFWSIDNDDFRGNCNGRPYPLIEAAKEAMFDRYNDNEVIKQDKVRKPGRSRSQSNSSTRNQAFNNEDKKKTQSRIKQTESRKRISSTTTTSTTTTPIPVTRTTPAPPTTPDPGADFKCEDEGFFPHPRDCKKYYWCLDSGPSNLGLIAHQFTCPSGLYFNPAADSCDFTRNVLCKKNIKQTTTKPTTVTTTKATTTTLTTPSKAIKLKTTSTTPEPEYENYEDDDQDEDPQTDEEKGTTKDPEEDPKVIKELIDLIKKVGGIKELEKLLQQDDQDNTTGAKNQKNSEKSRLQETFTGKSLYSKVLGRQNSLTSLKDRFSTLQAIQRNSKSSDITEDYKDDSSSEKYSSVVRNSRPRPQNDGINKLAEFDGFLREKPKYVTLNRSRPAATKSDESKSVDNKKVEEEDNDEDEDNEDEDDNEDDNERGGFRSRVTSEKPQLSSTLSYINIRRTLPSTTTAVPSLELTAATTEFSKVDETKTKVPPSFLRNRYKTLVRSNTQNVTNQNEYEEEEPPNVTVINTENNENTQAPKRKFVTYNATERRTTTPATQTVQAEDQQESTTKSYIKQTNTNNIFSLINTHNIRTTQSTSPTTIQQPLIETSSYSSIPTKDPLFSTISTISNETNLDLTEVPLDFESIDKKLDETTVSNTDKTNESDLLNLDNEINFNKENDTININEKIFNSTQSNCSNIEVLKEGSHSDINFIHCNDGESSYTKTSTKSTPLDETTTPFLGTISSPRPFTPIHKRIRIRPVIKNSLNKTSSLENSNSSSVESETNNKNNDVTINKDIDDEEDENEEESDADTQKSRNSNLNLKRTYRPKLTADELSSLLAVDLRKHKNHGEKVSNEPKVQTFRRRRPVQKTENEEQVKQNFTELIGRTQKLSPANTNNNRYSTSFEGRRKFGSKNLTEEIQNQNYNKKTQIAIDNRNSVKDKKNFNIDENDDDENDEDDYDENDYESEDENSDTNDSDTIEQNENITTIVTPKGSNNSKQAIRLSYNKFSQKLNTSVAETEANHKADGSTTTNTKFQIKVFGRNKTKVNSSTIEDNNKGGYTISNKKISTPGTYLRKTQRQNFSLEVTTTEANDENDIRTTSIDDVPENFSTEKASSVSNYNQQRRIPTRKVFLKRRKENSASEDQSFKNNETFHIDDDSANLTTKLVLSSDANSKLRKFPERKIFSLRKKIENSVINESITNTTDDIDDDSANLTTKLVSSSDANSKLRKFPERKIFSLRKKIENSVINESITNTADDIDDDSANLTTKLVSSSDANSKLRKFPERKIFSLRKKIENSVINESITNTTGGINKAVETNISSTISDADTDTETDTVEGGRSKYLLRQETKSIISDLEKNEGKNSSEIPSTPLRKIYFKNRSKIFQQQDEKVNNASQYEENLFESTTASENEKNDDKEINNRTYGGFNRFRIRPTLKAKTKLENESKVSTDEIPTSTVENKVSTEKSKYYFSRRKTTQVPSLETETEDTVIALTESPDESTDTSDLTTTNSNEFSTTIKSITKVEESTTTDDIINKIDDSNIQATTIHPIFHRKYTSVSRTNNIIEDSSTANTETKSDKDDETDDDEDYDEDDDEEDDEDEEDDDNNNDHKNFEETNKSNTTEIGKEILNDEKDLKETDEITKLNPVSTGSKYGFVNRQKGKTNHETQEASIEENATIHNISHLSNISTSDINTNNQLKKIPIRRIFLGRKKTENSIIREENEKDNAQINNTDSTNNLVTTSKIETNGTIARVRSKFVLKNKDKQTAVNISTNILDLKNSEDKENSNQLKIPPRRIYLKNRFKTSQEKDEKSNNVTQYNETSVESTTESDKAVRDKDSSTRSYGSFNKFRSRTTLKSKIKINSESKDSTDEVLTDNIENNISTERSKYYSLRRKTTETPSPKTETEAKDAVTELPEDSTDRYNLSVSKEIFTTTISNTETEENTENLDSINKIDNSNIQATTIHPIFHRKYTSINRSNIISEEALKVKNDTASTTTETKDDEDDKIDDDEDYDEDEEDDEDDADDDDEESDSNKGNESNKEETNGSDRSAQLKENNDKENLNQSSVTKVNQFSSRQQYSVINREKGKIAYNQSDFDSNFVDENSNIKQLISNRNHLESLELNNQQNNTNNQNHTNLESVQLCKNHNSSNCIESSINSNSFVDQFSSNNKTDILGNDVNQKIFFLNTNRRFQNDSKGINNTDAQAKGNYESTTKQINGRRIRVLKFKRPVTNTVEDKSILKSNSTKTEFSEKNEQLDSTTKIPLRKKVFIRKRPLTTTIASTASAVELNEGNATEIESKESEFKHSDRRIKYIKKIIIKNDTTTEKKGTEVDGNESLTIDLKNLDNKFDEEVADRITNLTDKEAVTNFREKIYLNRRPIRPTKLPGTSSTTKDLDDSVSENVNDSLNLTNLDRGKSKFRVGFSNIRNGNFTEKSVASENEIKKANDLNYKTIVRTNYLNRKVEQASIGDYNKTIINVNENENESENNEQKSDDDEDDDYDDEDDDDENDDENDYNDENYDNNEEKLEKDKEKPLNENFNKIGLINNFDSNSFNNRIRTNLQNYTNRRQNVPVGINRNITTKKSNRFRINRPNNIPKISNRNFPTTTPHPISNQISVTTTFPLTTPSIFKSTNTKLRKYTTVTSTTESTLKDDLLLDLNVNALNARNKKIFEITSKKHTTVKPKPKEQISILDNENNISNVNETQTTDISELSEKNVKSYSNNDLNNFQETALENSIQGSSPITEQPPVTTTQKATTFSHIFSVGNINGISTTEMSEIEKDISTTIENEEKLVEINRVVEVSSKENKLKLKSIGVDLDNIKTSDIKLVEPPHIDKLGEISRVKYVTLVESGEDYSTTKSYDELHNENIKYNDNILNESEKRGRQLILPEVIRGIETSTIPLEGLFKTYRKSKANEIHYNSPVYALSLGEAYITSKPITNDDDISYEPVYKGESKDEKIHEDIKTTTSSFLFDTTTVQQDRTTNYIRPIVPLLRPESNESSPLVISIANLDKSQLTLRQNSRPLLNLRNRSTTQLPSHSGVTSIATTLLNRRNKFDYRTTEKSQTTISADENSTPSIASKLTISRRKYSRPSNYTEGKKSYRTTTTTTTTTASTIKDNETSTNRLRNMLFKRKYYTTTIATTTPISPSSTKLIEKNRLLPKKDNDQEVDSSIQDKKFLDKKTNYFDNVDEKNKDEILVEAIKAISQAPIPVSITSASTLKSNFSSSDAIENGDTLKISTHLPDRSSTSHNISHKQKIRTTIKTTTQQPSSTTEIIRQKRPTKIRQPFDRVTSKQKFSPENVYRPITDYDYYDDDDVKVIAKSNSQVKVILHGRGLIECLDQGNFPHPLSCRKFISCAKMETGGVVGWEYTCPKNLSYDPVGGICNWAAGLGCKD